MHKIINVLKMKEHANIYVFVTIFLQILKVTYSQDRRIDFKYDRIVIDLTDIRLGTYLDYSYNETIEFPGQLVSSPGCPKAYEGRQWLYHGNPVKCYLEGFRGPCPFGQRIFSSSNSKYGVCNCDCFTEEIKSTQSSSDQIVYYNHGIQISNTATSQLLLPNRRRVRSHYSTSSNSYHDYRNRVKTIKSATTLTKLDEIGRRCNKSESSATTLTPPTTTSPTPPPSDEDDAFEITSYLLKAGKRIDPVNRYSFCYSDWYKRQVVYDSIRQKCVPFLTQGPCHKGEWLVRNLSTANGVECEKRKCPETLRSEEEKEKEFYGGSFSYFDYRRQTCYTEVFGNLLASNFATSGNIISGSNSKFCRDAGMRYSQILKTCVRDVAKLYQYKVIG